MTRKRPFFFLPYLFFFAVGTGLLLYLPQRRKRR